MLGWERSGISHGPNPTLLEYLPLNVLRAVSQALAYHLFSQKSNYNISGKSLSLIMDHIHLYEFHRRAHKWQTVYLVQELGKRILLWLCSEYLRLPFLYYKSDPHRASETNHSRREDTATVTKWATVRGLVTRWGLWSEEFQVWLHQANQTSYL